MTTAPVVGYIASTIPAKVIQVSGTTLFQVALEYAGDPLQWVAIAELNGLTDPWINELTELKIPPVFPTSDLPGIIGL
jgi:hypothetical protein